MITRRLAPALLLLLGAALSTAAVADQEEEIIKYRQHAMEAASAHLKSAAAILKGQVPFRDDLTKHAKALADLGPIMAAGFPAGSDFGDTDAKPEVWSKRAEFEKAADKLVHTSAAFAANPTGETLGALGKSCKACHHQFRE
ncbi:c-type cytochrome [Endothiovibrio diazotrophicus]